MNEEAYTLLETRLSQVSETLNRHRTHDQLAVGDTYYNVRIFGAKGDGVTDDTAAVQAAFDAMPDEGTAWGDRNGGIAFFPAGSYIVNGATPKHGTRIMGEGWWNSSIRSNSGSTGAFNLDSVTGPGTEIENLHFNTDGSPRSGIYLSGSNGVSIHDCWFNGYSGVNINSSTDVVVSDCMFDICTYGVQVGSSGNPANIRISDNQFYTCVHSLYITRIENSVIANNMFYDPIQEAILVITEIQTSTIANNEFRAGITTPVHSSCIGISIAAAQLCSCTITGNILTGAFKWGFNLSFVSGAITGNLIQLADVGIQVSTTGRGTISGNTITGTAAQSLKILSDNWVVTSNYLDGPASTTSVITCTHDYCIISNNRIVANGSTIVIDLTNTDFNLASRNLITGTYTTDISDVTANYVERYTIEKTFTWNPGSLADGAGEESASVAVSGAAFGDYVLVGAPYDMQSILVHGYVYSANNVRVRIQNESGGTIDLASGTWRVRVLK